ncbi:MAG: type II secretion system protein GspG [Minisyncoccia bacterium]
MKLPPINGRSRKNIIIFIFIAVIVISIAAVIFKDYFSKNSKPEFSVKVMTEKETYLRGEQIKFILTNNGTEPVWYFIPSAKCRIDFYWNILAGNDKIRDTDYRFPKCEISGENNDLAGIKILNPDESMNGAWDQKLFLGSSGNRYAGPGKYKIVFYYSTGAININDIKSGSDPGIKSAQSLKFKIGNDFYNDSARVEVQKENDAERKGDLAEIKKALETYYQANGRKYPESEGIVKLNDKNSGIYQILSIYLAEEFMSDPNFSEYYYGYSSDGTDFDLSARLENLEDENCEILAESLCIYKIDSSGNVSKKKYIAAEVLTAEKASDFFMEKLKIIDNDKQNTIIVTSDIIGNSERSILDTGGISLAEGVKIKKASEISQSELTSNNLVLTGSPQSNGVIEEILKKTTLVDIVEGVDIEKNSIKMAVKFAQNPWNNEKIILMLETDYSMGLNLSIRGVVKIEKRGDFNHIVIKSDSGKVYALVVSSDGSGFYVENLSEFDDKYVEIKGYERIRNSEKFPIEDGIGVMDIRVLE